MEQALHAVALLDHQGVTIPHNKVLDLVHRCSKAKDLVAGRQLYSILAKNGLDAVTILGNHLIRMFTSCGSLTYANEAFYQVTKPDAYTWNAIISANAKLGKFDDAFSLYHHMHNSDIKPNIVTFLCISKACACAKALEQGRLIHDHFIRSGIRGALTVENTLLDMYAKSGSLIDAERIFRRLTNRDDVTYGVMLTGYAHHEQSLPALELYEKMLETDIRPCKVVYMSVLKACAGIPSSMCGRQIHDNMVRNSFHLDEQIGSLLIEMYAKSGNFQEAHQVFSSLSNRDIVVWCSLIAGYCENGCDAQVLELYKDMQKATFQPDRVTFIYVLKACGGLRAFEHGFLIHGMIMKSSMDADIGVTNSVIDMYIKWGDLKGAFSTFNRLPFPDEVSWGTMIAGYVHHGHDHLALQFFESMQKEGIKPDKAIFLLSLKVCGDLGEPAKGNLVHQVLVEVGMQSDAVVANALIDMYGKFMGIEEATSVFDSISNKNIDSWDALIAAYSSNVECSSKAFALFEKVRQRGLKPSRGIFLSMLKICGGLKAAREGKALHDELIRSELQLEKVMENTIIDMYAKCGLLKEARSIFSKILEPNEVSWGVMIAGNVGCGKNFSALKLFERMHLHGMQANEVVSSSILKACANVGAIEHGRIIHDKILRSELVADDVRNSLVNLYAKCGSMDEAQKVFKSISKKNILSWGALIAGYVHHNNGLEALDLYKMMHKEKVKPNKAILLCALQACSTTGALAEGHLVYMQILDDGGKLDVHLGNTLVDVYAKCGSMQDASHVFTTLKVRDMVSWGVIMAGYVWNSECKQVESCFRSMEQQGLKPGDFIFTSILAACSHAGLLEEGLSFFKLMTVNYALLPSQKHYSCMTDLLGRAGWFEEVVDLLQSMPSPPDVVLWTSLLDSCKTHGNKGLGTNCFEELRYIDPEDASWYMLMLSICAGANTQADTEKIKRLKNLIIAQKDVDYFRNETLNT